MSFIRIWTYTVHAEHAEKFRNEYSSTGVWARYYAKGPGYLGTELFESDANTFCTIDRWDSRAVYEAYLAETREEFDSIDAVCEEWTSAEQLVFEGCDVAAR